MPWGGAWYRVATTACAVPFQPDQVERLREVLAVPGSRGRCRCRGGVEGLAGIDSVPAAARAPAVTARRPACRPLFCQIGLYLLH